MIQSTPTFTPWPKLARLNRDCVITEKLDGTNACIRITEDGQFLTGKRSGWCTPDDDNFGFSRWAHEHKDIITGALGVGTHFGEWWGAGIQRRYGMTEKRFSLFNTARWSDLPPCLSLVPVLYEGKFTTQAVEQALDVLRDGGSLAAPGFMKPEGIVVYHVAAGIGFKVTLEGDGVPKSQRALEAVA